MEPQEKPKEPLKQRFIYQKYLFIQNQNKLNEVITHYCLT